MNQILALKLRESVIKPLEDLVAWDRYGISGTDDNGFIFGWIKRDDGFYDFVVVRFCIVWSFGNNKFLCSYNTSSKKYSKEIAKRLGDSLQDYIECKSVRELEPETNLVRWQKTSVDPLFNIGDV